MFEHWSKSINVPYTHVKVPLCWPFLLSSPSTPLYFLAPGSAITDSTFHPNPFLYPQIFHKIISKMTLALPWGQCYLYPSSPLRSPHYPHQRPKTTGIGILQTHLAVTLPLCESHHPWGLLTSLLWSWLVIVIWFFKITLLLFTEGFKIWLPISVSILTSAIIPEDSKVYVYDPFINLALKYSEALNSNYFPFDSTFATHSQGQTLDFAIIWTALFQEHQTMES